MKKILFLGMIPAGMVLVYFLFEPIFVYNLGWKPLTVDEATGKILPDDAAGYYGAAVASARNVLITARETLEAPAFSVAVGVGGKLVWAEAQGYKDLDRRARADTATMFRIGSTSKAVTSVALGRLLYQQKLALDTPVQRYVPYVTIPVPITLRQLASHTSGIREYGMCLCFPVWEYYNNDRYTSIRQSVSIFQDDPLLSVPGAAYHYSSYNTTLIAAAIEAVAGETFQEYMRHEIFNPLQMRHTRLDYTDSAMENRAVFYEVVQGQYKIVYPVDNSNKWAGGGFVATPSDLVRLGNGLFAGRLFPRHVLDTLFAPQKLSNGLVNDEGYALGWRSNRGQKIFGGRQTAYVVHHGGVAMGSTSFFVLFPEYDMSVAIMMNRNAPNEFREFSMYAFLVAEAFIQAMVERPA
jgi:CubicO group peptidase (beta-lactamase class C family)